jgi:hypothetical protein
MSDSPTRGDNIILPFQYAMAKNKAQEIGHKTAAIAELLGLKRG